MKLKSLLFILISFSLLIIPPLQSVESSGGSTVVNYLTEVTVKLLPDKTFSAKITGSYVFINLDTSDTIPLSNSKTVQFQQDSTGITASNDEKTFTSSTGFGIYETVIEEGNEVEISSILNNKGPVPVVYRGSFTVKPGEESPLLFNILSMEDYLKGVVPSEMPPSWAVENPKAIEALKAQAVAARSYAYTQLRWKDYLEMTVASQVYGGKSKEHPLTNEAIKETDGVYATYNNIPIDAFFHSSSGGYTENSEDVWSSEVPYIRAVEDPYDQQPNNSHYDWSISSSVEPIQEKLQLKENQILLSLRITETTQGQGVQQIAAIIYDTETKAKDTINLYPELVSSADRFRSFFGFTLKSIKFTLTADSDAKVMLADGTQERVNHLLSYKVQKADGSTVTIDGQNVTVTSKDNTAYYPTTPSIFTFNGKGWGHALGMSQWGARGMAEAGFTYDQILTYYYTGIEVKKLQ